ncbi:response regulator [Patescibacteria group bacterium]|nr:response regulator [Patescibacteria group bacterium]
MSSNKNTILLIEDEESLITLYSTLFKLKYKVIVARNKEEAFEKVEANSIDLVLLDIIIPTEESQNIDYNKRAGFEFLKEIKARDKFKKLKVIVLTNLDSTVDRKKALELGASEYIVKSNMLPNEILEVVENIF